MEHYSEGNNKVKSKPKGGLYEEVKKIAYRSGLQRRVYPHMFRKTTATNVVRRGGTVDDAGCYLGHKGSSVTQRHYIATLNSENIFRNYVQTI